MDSNLIATEFDSHELVGFSTVGDEGRDYYEKIYILDARRITEGFDLINSGIYIIQEKKGREGGRYTLHPDERSRENKLIEISAPKIIKPMDLPSIRGLNIEKQNGGERLFYVANRFGVGKKSILDILREMPHLMEYASWVESFLEK